MRGIIFAGLMAITAIANAATIKYKSENIFGDKKLYNWVNGVSMINITYSEQHNTLRFYFGTQGQNNKASCAIFKVESLEQAEKIINKVMDNSDNSIIDMTPYQNTEK